MKKVTLMLTVTLYSILTVFAQHGEDHGDAYKSGSVMIGGSSNLTTLFGTKKWKNDDADGKEGKFININFSPSVDFFVMDALAVGANLRIGYNANKPDDPVIGEIEKTTITTLLLAPRVTYYYGNKNIKPFGGVSVGLGRHHTTTDRKGIDAVKHNANIFLWMITGGIAVDLNEKVALDLGLLYEYEIDKDVEDNENNHKDIETGFGLEVGIKVFL